MNLHMGIRWHDIGWPQQPMRTAPVSASLLLGASAWVTLNPYFFWGQPLALLIAALAAVLAGTIAFFSGNFSKPSKLELLGIALLTAFVIYITVQSRLDGGHTKWIFVLPTLWSLAFFPVSLRKQCLEIFAWIFAASVVPGLLASWWLAAGMPMQFNLIPAANSKMSAWILQLPGILFTESNQVVLPWGGVLFRLNGVYDEPGTVGTISGLLLAAFGFRLNQWRNALIFTAGIMSFSLAFVVLVSIGLICRGLFTRKLWPLAALLPLLLSTSLSLGVLNLGAPVGVKTVVAIKTPDTGVGVTTISPEILAPSSVHDIVSSGQQLRQTEYVNNRTLPEMKALLTEYWRSDIGTILFGMGSDASVVRGGVSQVWTRHLTNHGIVGCGLLVVGCIAVAFALWRTSGYSPLVALFFLLFALSFYQRPVIWMPYALLILLCGPYAAIEGQGKKEKEES